jgi:hypothetical protein
VWRVTITNQPSSPGSYYYATEDVLWMLSGDEGLVEDVLELLPGSNGSLDVTAAGDPPPVGSGTVHVRFTVDTTGRACVAEPFGRKWFHAVALDDSYQVPLVATFFAMPSAALETNPSYVENRSVGTFEFRARELADPNSITIDAVTPTGSGVGIGTARTTHCLNGLWDDGGRAIVIDHFGGTVDARWTEETGCHSAGGLDFGGDLPVAGTTISNGFLEACAPEECVEAGALEPAVLVEFTGEVYPDGNRIDIFWDAQQYDLVYDEENNVIGCTPTHKEPRSFSVTRNTFGPGLPF